MPDFTITSNNPEGLIQQLRAIQQTGCGALTKECWAIANQIEEQVKPVVQEPTTFGSVVRAKSFGPVAMLWQRCPDVADRHYWESETGATEAWQNLTDVEVLRVGIGEPAPMTEEEIDESQATAQRNIQKWEPLGGFARTKTLDQDAFDAGFSACRSVVHNRLQKMLKSANNAWYPSHAIEQMIAAVEELAP